MADHGGYRKPSKPAVVSGPGKYSKRTDGGPAQVISAAPDQPYGDAGQQMNDQRIAPMAASEPLPTPPSPETVASSSPSYQGVPFDAESQRPDEPVTAGLPIGEGAGPEALTLGGFGQNVGRVNGDMTKLLGRLMGTDLTGVLAKLYQQAQAGGN